MSGHTLTHNCPVNGRTELAADWKPDAKELRAECDHCECAVYADRSGVEHNTVSLTI